MRTFRTRTSAAALGASLLLISGQDTFVHAEGKDGIDIVKAGKAHAVIALPESPSPVVRYAAKELQSHVERSTGVRLEITSESKIPKEKTPIYIGPVKKAAEAGIIPTDLPKNASRVLSTEEALFLIGNDGNGTDVLPRDDADGMGSLFAVYEWLENQLGVRWIWPGDDGIVVDAKQELAGGALGDKTVLPSMIHARLRIGTGRTNTKLEVFERYMNENAAWLRRHRFARGVSFEYGHGYVKYWDLYGKKHPEYFALRPDGQRAPADERTKLVQMCVSNQGLQSRIIEDWLKQRAEDPSKPWINGIENDRRLVDPFCTCPECTAWDAKAGGKAEGEGIWLIDAEQSDQNARAATPSVSLSNRYARFWLALQELGRKHDPEATVIGYAYAAYSAPPEGIKLNRNIVVGIVPPYTFPFDKNDRMAFRKQWDGWANTGARLFLRPNYFLLGYCMPYIFAREFGEEFQYARKHGLIATDFDSLTSMWGVQGPNAYMLARLHAKQEASVDEILNEYYDSFKPAAKEVRAYFEHWEKVTLRRDAEFVRNHKGGWAIISASGDALFTPDTFQEGRALLDAARDAAKDSPATGKRVEYLSLWLTHAELCMRALSTYHASKEDPRNINLKNGALEAKTAVDQFREEHKEMFATANLAILRRVEAWAGWRSRAEVDAITP